MRALTTEWLEFAGQRARLIGIIISDDGETRFHVRTWPKGHVNVAKHIREEVWTFDQITKFVADSSRTYRAGMEGWKP